jgi:hypothetical protein
MTKYRIIKRVYPNGQVDYEVQKKILGLFWWNFNNIDAIETGIYSTLGDAEMAIRMDKKEEIKKTIIMQPRKRKSEGNLAELTANVTEEMLAKTRREMIDELILAEKQKLINKACVWLSNVSIEDMTYKYDDFDTSEGWYKFIEDFRKHMEE